MKALAAFAISVCFQTAAAQANELPEKFTCAFDAFRGGGPVIQELVLQNDRYVNVDIPFIKYQVIGDTSSAFHLVQAAGGAFTTIAIEVSDGSMLKVTSATFGHVDWSRGKCRW